MSISTRTEQALLSYDEHEVVKPTHHSGGNAPHSGRSSAFDDLLKAAGRLFRQQMPS